VGSKQEAVSRSWLDCYAAGDRGALLDHYSDDASYHVIASRPALVGREAIRAELDRQFDRVSDYRSTILNICSTDAVVFIEGIDTFKHSGRDVTLHWSSVQEISSAGKIRTQRDYWDSKELEAQLK
jgi:hypothetical protein